MSRRPSAISLVLAVVLAAGASLAPAQQLGSPSNENPVYLADSPIAEESLARLPELLAQDNLDEAVRLSDEVITELGNRLIRADPNDPDRVHIPVRERMHDFILAHPQLLETYRIRVTPAARIILSQGQWEQVARDAWLTEPGFIASTRRAQTLIEAARFHAGLSVLSQLESHPDADALAPRASSLARLVAGYVDTDDAWALASRWATRAGEPPLQRLPAPLPPSRSGDLVGARLLDWQSQREPRPVSLEGVVPGPLARAPLTPEPQVQIVADAQGARISGANWSPTAWVAPLVVGTSLYTNDGITVSSFDRFTLRPNWRVQTTADTTELPITPDSRSRLGRIIEDMTGLTHDAGSLYAAAGIPKNGARDGDARLLKLDAASGAILWSVDITDLDPALADASIRGPVIVDKGTVLVAARTSNRRQRLISLSVAGLDAATGRLRWVRQIASAGSLPFQQIGQLAHNPTVRDGVAYYTDHIGLGFAVRIATGDILWARPLPAPDLYARFAHPSFAGNSPVINRHGLFVLATDGSRILQLDPQTGHTLASRPADPLGEIMYLLAIDDDRFAGVSPDQITVYDARAFAHAGVRKTPQLGGDAGIRGRVLAITETLYVPVARGVRIIDPADPREGELIELDRAGNILALDGQVIVLDEMEATSFLAWETASRLLEERIDRDAGAAITLAELAYRARHADQVVPAVERAIRELRTEPLEQRRAMEDHLFQTVLDMIVPETTPPPRGTDAFSLGVERTDALLGHLEDLARTHEQVLAQRMALGAFRELRSDPGGAIAAYQDILDQPPLSAAMWQGPDIAVRGGLEATRRTGGILTRAGYGPYHPINERAQAERRFIDTSDDPDQFEQLADRYPYATIAPALRLQAARLHKQRASTPAVVRAAQDGIAAADELARLGAPVDPDIVAALGELGISGLLDTNRAAQARALAKRISERFPSAAIMLDGQPVNAASIERLARDAERMPRLGDAFLKDQSPVLLTGSPVSAAQRTDPGGVVMYAPQLGRIEYLRLGRGAGESAWTLPALSNNPPLIPWQSQDRTIVFWPEGTKSRDAGTLQAVDTLTGELAWNIADLRFKLAEPSARLPDDLARAESMFPLPVGGSAPITQILVATDGQTVIVSDRIGRAMGVDFRSGEILWRRDLPLNRVHDLDLGGSVLAVTGLMVADQAQRQREGAATSVVASIDPRSGENIQVIDGAGQQPRWILAGPSGKVYVATRGRIIALDTNAGAFDWALRDEQLEQSDGAWISADQLVVLDSANALWLVDLETGERSPVPVDTRALINSNGWVQLFTGLDRITLATSRGLLGFGHDRQVLAADALPAEPEFAGVAWGGQRAVFVRRPTFVRGHASIEIHLLETPGARVLDSLILDIPPGIDRDPGPVAAVNGGLIVGFGEVSVFVRTDLPVR